MEPANAYERYLAWADKHGEWVAVLDQLKHCDQGFSFTRGNERPEGNPVYVGKSYLHETRIAEQKAAQAWYDTQYRKLRERYEAGLAAYLEIGEIFLADITDPRKSMKYKHDLMVDVQRRGHLMHNAAVLWLEANPGADLGDHDDYEELLKVLWVADLRDSHREWAAGRPTARQSQLLLYFLGRQDLDTIPRWNDPHLADVRKASHVTLGKVLLRGEQALPLQRWLHPCYWGLFLLSPLHDQDRGPYVPDDKDALWIEHLINDLHMPTRNFRHVSSGFQIHEIVPRPVAARTYCGPGIYLHRSWAHGRDDFLTVVPGGQPGSPSTPLVFCTKGVGGDPELIGSETARTYQHVDRFRRRFAGPTAQFPFAYPVKGDTDSAKAGSWRNIGFCTAFAGDEVSAVDFDNFQTMYTQASAHRLSNYGHGFVQPIALVEISCLPRNAERMPDVMHGVEAGAIGYPVQIVTCSPIETSLRLSKEGKAQDYIYRDLSLEILEWDRVLGHVQLPAKITDAVAADIEELRGRITRYVVDAIGGHKEIGWESIVGYGEENLPARLTSLRDRMLLAFKVMWEAFAAWQIFLDHGWASDTYTGSFSGRNFNSGPRDSNDWGLLDRPTEDQQPGTGGEGLLCLHIDLGNLANTFNASGGEAFKMLELTPPDLEEETIYEACYMWKGSALFSVALSIAQILAQVKAPLNDRIWTAAQKKSDHQERSDFIAAELAKEIRARVRGDSISPLLRELLSWWK